MGCSLLATRGAWSSSHLKLDAVKEHEKSVLHKQATDDKYQRSRVDTLRVMKAEAWWLIFLLDSCCVALLSSLLSETNTITTLKFQIN